MRLSNRDILLLVGIVVAVVVTLTAVVYRDQAAAAKREIQNPKKTSWNATVHELINALGKRSSVKYSR